MQNLRTQRFADKIGAEYGLFPLADPHYDEVQTLLARFTADHFQKKTVKILEIGCGTGLTTKKIVEFLPEAAVVALDNEEVMLEQARKALRNNPRVEFIRADALTYLRGPAQKDETFDAVVTAFCLHNLPPDYRRSSFKEMGRITRSGGIIISADKIAQDDILEHWRALSEQIDAFEVFQTTQYPELQAEWTSHYLDDDRVRFTETEQKELLGLAGCGKIECKGRWRMDALYCGIKQ